MTTEIKLRDYCESDLESLVELYTKSVHQLACDHYDAAQREAWAPRPPDYAKWREQLSRLHTVVADCHEEIAGFISYESTGRIAFLFVAPAFQGQGVAWQLYQEVESRLTNRGIKKLFTEASKVAHPFFDRQGFVIVEEQQVVTRNGVALRRYLMQKQA